MATSALRAYQSFPPTILIFAFAIAMVLVSETFVGGLLAFVGGFWASLFLFGPKSVQEGIEANLKEFGVSPDSPEAESDEFQAPNRWLSRATDAWMYATGVVFVEFLLVGVVPPIDLAETHNFPLLASIPIIGYAGLETYRVSRFIRNRMYFAQSTFADYVARLGLIVGVLFIDYFYISLMVVLFPGLSYYPLGERAFTFSLPLAIAVSAYFYIALGMEAFEKPFHVPRVVRSAVLWLYALPAVILLALIAKAWLTGSP